MKTKALLLAACLLALTACNKSQNATHNITDTQGAQTLSFLALHGARGQAGQTRYIVDLAKKEITTLTLSRPDEVLRFLNIENGPANAVGTIYDVGTRAYAIITADLTAGTYKRIYTTQNPVLEVAACANGNMVFTMGKKRSGGVNQMTDRALFRRAAGADTVQMLTQHGYYQLALQNVDADCKGASFSYYGRNGEESTADRLAYTREGKDVDVEAPSTPGKPVGGDVDPIKKVMILRDGYYANGETLIVAGGKVIAREPYTFASEAALSPDATQGFEVTAGADAEGTSILQYDMKTGAKTAIPLKGMTMATRTLQAD